MPQHLSAFMSYAHEDDEQDDYYLSEFRDTLCREVSNRLGREFSIFQDRANITLGQKWKTQIKNALSSITFFMPVLTPAFFESRECRAELEIFLARETEMHRDDLIWPIYYIECSVLENEKEAEQNRYAQKILEHHYADWRKLRKVPLTSPAAVKLIQVIAGQICVTVKRKVWRPEINQDNIDRVDLLDSFPAHEGGKAHTGSINDLAFSPSSEILATGSDDGTVRLWDMPNGDLIYTFEGHTNFVTSVAFSPDGETLVSGSHDGTVRLWSVSSGELQHVFNYRKPPARPFPEDVGREKYVSAVAFNPGEPQVAAAYFDDYIRIWSLDKRKLLSKWKGLPFMTSLAFLPTSGTFLAAGSMSDAARVWMAYDGELVFDLKAKDKKETAKETAPLFVNSLAFSPDGYVIATAANTDVGNLEVDLDAPRNHCIRLWSIRDGTFLRELTGHTGDVHDIAFSVDGTLLASVADDSTLGLWNVADGALLSILEVGSMASLAFAPNGNLLACGSNDGNVTLLGIK